MVRSASCARHTKANPNNTATQTNFRIALLQNKGNTLRLPLWQAQFSLLLSFVGSGQTVRTQSTVSFGLTTCRPRGVFSHDGQTLSGLFVRIRQRSRPVEAMRRGREDQQYPFRTG